ncbi:DUF2332 domain-containing protein [Sphingomonas morindae]|uniref:DUF2332 family protein n=1 Tax=Sphingomonas morindae TaxID=1541170 RepID=A0ABY4XCZ7_9SPHN|nr:DUF2332 family protein [Sphingomonas morindae]USI74844.1 DUF2332 family protein [Sphingomonas morindae]
MVVKVESEDFEMGPAGVAAAAPALAVADLTRQAALARSMGSLFVGAVLDAAARQLHRAPRLAARIADWPGDHAMAALALRVNAALHALARRRGHPALTRLYERGEGDFDGVIGAVLAAEEAFILDWMAEPTQTNEVARSAAIMAALMVATQGCPMPVALLELGASAGLNLHCTRYRYDLGGRAAGRPDSPVIIAPQWRGPPPPAATPVILTAEGVDRHPLDPGSAADRARLLAYVWADQGERLARLHAALALACHQPPRVTRGDVVDWITARLATPQPDGTARAIIHSMVLQYLDAGARAAVEAEIAQAGACATAGRPLWRIAFEWTAARDAVHLCLTRWPGGVTHHLATCHAYGAWIAWHG